MTNLTRIAAAIAALAVAAPALPCGLMQHEAASTTPQPAVAETAKPEAQPQSTQPQKAEPRQARPEKKLARAEKRPTVAKN